MQKPRYYQTPDGRIATVTTTEKGIRVELPAKGALPAEVIFGR